MDATSDIGGAHRLSGQVAVVTGAAGGIGRAIAARLLAEGAIVLVNDLDAERCAQVSAELTTAGGIALGAPGSVSDPADTDAVVALAELEFGRLDILVNNAGVTRDAPIHKMSDDDWRLVHDVGLRGAFCMCRSAHRLLRGPSGDTPTTHRKVVNMSSSVGLHGAPGTANYSAAKAGVIGLTRALAREWARHRINVNALAPGLVSGTGLTNAKPAELIERAAAQVPLGRAGTPEDVAAAAAFLSSSDSDYITGHVLELNGGVDVFT